ncbi:MAG: hypothetical protein L0956_07010 [Candidatus Mariimomonas ferrooxydans]
MKRLLYAGIAAILALSLYGCGSADSRDVFVARIFSDQLADGDIAFDPVLNSYTVTNGPNTIFFGIDDADPNFPEFRAFMDFPLDGSNGGDAIPLNADIRSATLEVFIDEVSFALTVPALLDLVEFSIAGLTPADFDSSPLRFPDGTDATLNFDLFSSDQGNFVLIDVTPLMRETQRLGLSDFQVRFLLDFVTNVGLVGIEDRPNITMTAPLLTVEYR